MTQTEARIFGFFVSTMRKHQGWTLEALAHATNYSYSMIRSIEKGTSKIDKDGRDKFARLFGFASFLDNYNEKDWMQDRLQQAQKAHASLLREKRQEILSEILDNTSLVASYLFPEFLLAKLFWMFCTQKPEEQIENLGTFMEPVLEFFNVRQLGLYYDLLGMNISNIDKETEYFRKAFSYDPDSFLINLHMATNASFHQHLIQAKEHLERCKKSVFELGSYSRFVQIACFEAQIRIDLGEIDPALQCLEALYQDGSTTNNSDRDCQITSLMAYGFLRKNDMENALRYAQYALRQEPDNATLHLICLFAAFRLDDARFPVFVHHAKDRIGQSNESAQPSNSFMPWNVFINGIVAWHAQDLSKAMRLFEQCVLEGRMSPWRSFLLECLIELAKCTHDPCAQLSYQEQLTDLLRIQMMSVL